MLKLDNQRVLVVGLGQSGRAACELLCRSGARVVGVDSADTPDLRAGANRLRPLGIEVALGVQEPPRLEYNLAIVSRGATKPMVQALHDNHVPMIGDLELGYQQSQCLCIAVTGTNGKSTTAELVERALTSNHQRAVRADPLTRPVCGLVEQSKELDYLVLEVNASQLEMTETFRPSVAVVTNLTPGGTGQYADTQEYARLSGRVFRNQQPFDWAIVQREALGWFQQLDAPLPAKLVTFSATDPDADLRLERGMVVSRLPGWTGPLLDTAHCLLRGPHNAENLMAALAVGHALRLPLECMVDTMKTFPPGPHCFEITAEINGVQFVNDAKCSNPGALEQALLGVRRGKGAEPNVWLIAGGGDVAHDFHDAGPVVSRRVKRAILLGDAGEKMRSAWSLFVPCATASSVLEAVAQAAENAASGDVVLYSPAGSVLEDFRDYQNFGEIFCRAVKSIGRGVHNAYPNIHGGIARARV